MLLKHGQYSDLIELVCNPSDYLDHRSFEDDYLVTSILQKNSRLPLGVDRKAVALSKFKQSEEVCRATNSRLERFFDGQDLPDPDVALAIHYARETIRRILGALSSEKLEYAYSKMRFGPGATTSVSGIVTQGKKYSHRLYDVTPRLASFRAFGFPPLWRETVRDIRLQECSKVATVPKNAKTDRVICIEPDLNIFVQLGIGALLREQLRKFGLDLNTQETNRSLAKEAIDGLCTMDLSAASDTISRNAVWCLLPDSWCDLLHYCRVDKTLLDGEVVPLEKWSSMGNGYTFELESLIFIGILYGCMEACGNTEFSSVTAYGDDLIFPSSIESVVRRTLDFLGFKVNSEKTFGTGCFRESCGTDWFDGHNVRPFFLRSEHHDFETVCYIYANGLRHWAHRRNSDGSSDVRLLSAWLRCYNAVGKGSRHLIPSGFGDVGFVEEFDRSTPSIFYDPKWVERGWTGHSFLFREVKAQSRRIDELGCYFSYLNGNKSDFSLARESLRGRFQRPKTRRGYALAWQGLGPWA
jgi:hypothetical protein